MAIAVASYSAANWDLSPPLLITKPTGLTAGDLMFCVIGSFANATSEITPPAGWTQVDAQDAGVEVWASYYKVADAGDAAASDFSFTTTGGDGLAGIMLRITGANPVMTNISKEGPTTGTFSGADLTPTTPNSLFIFSVFNIDTKTISGYAMATSNPTWTEAGNLSSGGARIALAYAVRPEATSSGDFSVDTVASSSHYGGFICIAPRVDVTVSPSVVDLTLSVQAPSITGGATVSPAVIPMTTSIQAPTVSTPANNWDNQNKNTSTWVNDTKN